MTKQLNGLAVHGIRKDLVKLSSFQCPPLHWMNLWVGIYNQRGKHAKSSLSESHYNIMCEEERQITTRLQHLTSKLL